MTEPASDPPPGPGRRAADTASRIWGAILIAAGLWFLADQTLGLAMPRIPWGEIWPLGLILLGAVVIARGLSRRPR
jgi:hypothetical protein